MEDYKNSNPLKFMDCFSTYDLLQHVLSCTHNRGPLLTLVITSTDNIALPNETIVVDLHLVKTDHHWFKWKFDVNT